MDAKIIRPVQLVYFNDRPWYGVELIGKILGDVAKLVPVKKTLPAGRGDPVILFSFLAAREFQRMFIAMDRAGLPYLSKNRGKGYPLLIVGGGAMMNPEPIADFADIICIGEGELWAETIRNLLSAGKDRDYIFDVLSELPGAYVPNRREITYDSSGIFVKSVTGDSGRIAPAVTAVLPDSPYPVGDHRSIEVARSCASKCTFCSIGWTMEYREQPIEKVKEMMAGTKTAQLWASNMGAVSYYSEIEKLQSGALWGKDTRIDDFLRYPYPNDGDYSKKRFTFGLEGINERLRAILGKYITDDQVEKMVERVDVGQAQKAQFYYIRGVPSETSADWRRFREWIEYVLSRFDPRRVAVEFMMTPLTRTPHTPLQWVEQKYNFESESETLELLAYAQKRKKDNPESMLYITPSRRGPGWLLDTAFYCGSRKLGRFLYAAHSGKIGNLHADSFAGQGFDLVKKVLAASGTDPDALVDGWDPDVVLPWSFIMPFGERGDRARLAAYRKVMKLIEANKTGAEYNPISREIQFQKPGSTL